MDRAEQRARPRPDKFIAGSVSCRRVSSTGGRPHDGETLWEAVNQAYYAQANRSRTQQKAPLHLSVVTVVVAPLMPFYPEVLCTNHRKDGSNGPLWFLCLRLIGRDE